jgi:hypothetical protein
MTTIYIDGSAAIQPDAAVHLAHLPDAGHDVYLVGGRADTVDQEFPWRGRLDVAPDEPPRGSWYITADPATCGDRRPGLRTVLIGPRGAGPRPTRCPEAPTGKRRLQARSATR